MVLILSRREREEEEKFRGRTYEATRNGARPLPFGQIKSYSKPEVRKRVTGSVTGTG